MVRPFSFLVFWHMMVPSPSGRGIQPSPSYLITSERGREHTAVVSGCCVSIGQIISIAFVPELPCNTLSLVGKRRVLFSVCYRCGKQCAVCVSPVLTQRSSGPVDKPVQLRTGSAVWDHSSLLQRGADHGPKSCPNTIPAMLPSSLPACSGNPSRAPLAASKPGHRCRRLCISFQGQPRASPPLLRSL